MEEHPATNREVRGSNPLGRTTWCVEIGGRSPGCGPGRRGFESRHTPHLVLRSWGRTPDCRSGSSGFNSRQHRHFLGFLAQLVEHLTLNQTRPGSSPGEPTISCGDRETVLSLGSYPSAKAKWVRLPPPHPSCLCSSAEEHRSASPGVGGSTPPTSSIFTEATSLEATSLPSKLSLEERLPRKQQDAGSMPVEGSICPVQVA